jgi:hypothetical protein
MRGSRSRLSVTRIPGCDLPLIAFLAANQYQNPNHNPYGHGNVLVDAERDD